jgi:predicted ester cyclase
MSNEQSKLLARRCFEALANNDQTTLRELLDPDLVVYLHSPIPQNREEYLRGTCMWHASFGDTHFAIGEQIAEGDKIATFATLRANHNAGVFQGLPPTNKAIAVEGITALRIKDGRIVELRIISDRFGLLQQIGLVPPP